MSEMIKVGMLGILGILIAIQFRSHKPEYSTYIGLALGFLLFGYTLKEFDGVLGQLQTIQDYLGTGKKYLAILIKVIGITYICEFSSSICKDAGYGTVAEQIEILGKLAIMFAGLPILFAVLEQLQSLVG